MHKKSKIIWEQKKQNKKTLSILFGRLNRKMKSKKNFTSQLISKKENVDLHFYIPHVFFNNSIT